MYASNRGLCTCESCLELQVMNFIVIMNELGLGVLSFFPKKRLFRCLLWNQARKPLKPGNCAKKTERQSGVQQNPWHSTVVHNARTEPSFYKRDTLVRSTLCAAWSENDWQVTSLQNRSRFRYCQTKKRPYGKTVLHLLTLGKKENTENCHYKVLKRPTALLA